MPLMVVNGRQSLSNDLQLASVLCSRCGTRTGYAAGDSASSLLQSGSENRKDDKHTMHNQCIAISPVISKVLENCIIDESGSFFITSDNQFVFKKALGCNYAMRAVPNIVDGYIKGGRTANLCAIDLSKAFDEVNHRTLFIKLMKRFISNQLLDLLVSWLYGCYSIICEMMMLGQTCLVYILESARRPRLFSVSLRMT